MDKIKINEQASKQEFDMEYIAAYGRISNDENNLAETEFVTPEKTEAIFNNFINPFLNRMIRKWDLDK